MRRRTGAGERAGGAPTIIVHVRGVSTTSTSTPILGETEYLPTFKYYGSALRPPVGPFTHLFNGYSLRLPFSTF